MKASDIPTRFSEPFANDAGPSYIRVIPATTVDPAAASLELGFPPDTFTPVDAGGTPPDGRDFNGVLFQTTGWAQWLAAGGPIPWNSTFSTDIGGYPNGAIVQSAITAGTYWRCDADDNTTNPDVGGANWTAWPPSSSYVGTPYIDLVINNEPVTPNSKLVVQAATAVLSNVSNATAVVSAVNVIVDITVSGAGGLDTGSEASSTWYYVWLIYNGSTVAALLSLSSTAPTMPSGYTYKSLVGCVYNNASSNFRRFVQRDNRIQSNEVWTALAAGTASSLTAIDLSTFVPPKTPTRPVYLEALIAARRLTGDQIYTFSIHADNTDASAQFSAAAFSLTADDNGYNASSLIPIAPQTVYYKVTSGTDQYFATLYVRGFEF